MTQTSVRHGYTLDDIHRLARVSAAARRSPSVDFSDHYDAAWFAVVEMLYTTDDRPTEIDLAHAALDACQRYNTNKFRSYGYRDRNPYAGVATAPRFARYWTPSADTPLDEGVCERVGLAQIMGRLSARHRSVLNALAAHDNQFDAAAAALGMSLSAFHLASSEARSKVLRLWFEGETPRRSHRFNRRHMRARTSPQCGTRAAYRRHLRIRETPCDECREENNKQSRESHQRRRVGK